MMVMIDLSQLELILSEMGKAGLSFSLTEVRMWMVHVLCPREWLCYLMAKIFPRHSEVMVSLISQSQGLWQGI